MSGPAASVATAAVVVLFALPARAQSPPDPSPAPGSDAAVEADKPSLRDDKRRTMKGYWNNLAYNFLGVVTPGNHEPLLVTAALTAPAFAWDDDAQKYFERHPHPQFGRIGSQLGGSVAVAGLTIGFFSAGRYVTGHRFRASTYDVSQAIIVNQAWTQALKFTVRRPRPDGSNRVSFPSGHSSNAFCAATVIVRHYPRLAVPGFAVATYISVSRMAANKHHFSDIVAGAGFGYGVGRLVTRRNSREPGPPAAEPATSLSIVPDGGPAGDGAGLRLVVTF
jgi:membrane-associated phospholipid phosphatase